MFSVKKKNNTVVFLKAVWEEGAAVAGGSQPYQPWVPLRWGRGHGQGVVGARLEAAVCDEHPQPSATPHAAVSPHLQRRLYLV